MSVSRPVVPNSLRPTPWTAARQALLSMRFSRQGYWSGLPFPFPGDLPDPGIEFESPALQADSLLTELQEKPPELLTVRKLRLRGNKGWNDWL